MNQHSERQRDILRKIGVDVWKLREAEAVEIVESGEVAKAETAEVAKVAKVAKVETTEVKAKDTSSAPAPVAESPPVGESAGDTTLADIEKEVSVCRKCELYSTRTNTVFGCGSAEADWLFIGEAPGQNEDQQGQPFVGRAGKLLDMMIAALGMKREQVFIANVLKCRPPDNRDPLPAEIEQCEPYLHRQLALVKPKVIVALGRISAQALLKSTEPLGKLRGGEYYYGPDKIPLVATYHPAYLLRSPGQKVKAWEDLWQAKMIAQNAPTPD